MLISTLDDIREILRITGIDAEVVHLYTAPQGKHSVYRHAMDLHSRGELDMGPLMNAAMADEAVRANKKAVPPYAQQLVKEFPRTAMDTLERISSLDDEDEFLEENKDFLEREVGCRIVVQSTDSDSLEDPGNKARQAIPGRVAIYVE